MSVTMKQNRMTKGVVLMVLSSVVFCVMSVLIKCIPGIDSFKTSLFRFFIGMAVLGTAALFGFIHLRFLNGRLLFLRGLFGGISVFLFFLSIAKLGIAKGTVISYSYPIFASVLGIVFLHEKPGWRQWLALAAALFGIILLSGSASGISGLLTVGVYEVLALVGAICSAIAVVVIKRLHDTDSTYAIFYSQCVIGLWLIVVPANLVPCSIGYLGGAILLGIGLAATVAQLLMTEGYRYTSVSVGSLLCMTLPVFNFLVGVLVFHEPMPLRAVVGSIIVIASCMLVIMIEDHSEPVISKTG